MKVIVNKNIFLKSIRTLPISGGISLLADASILSVTNFESGKNIRLPAYIVDSGQAYLLEPEWIDLVKDVIASKKLLIDLHWDNL